MANGLDKPAWDSAIKAALTKARDDGQKDGAESDDVITNLADELATAIRDYLETARVVTTHTIPKGHTGQPVEPPTMVAGLTAATTGPDTATGPTEDDGSDGNLTYTDDDRSVLNDDIRTAYIAARDEGSATGAVSSSVIANLAAGVCNGIHAFALKGITDTVYETTGGVDAPGFKGPVSQPVEILAKTGPGTGTATGTLS